VSKTKELTRLWARECYESFLPQFGQPLKKSTLRQLERVKFECRRIHKIATLSIILKTHALMLVDLGEPFQLAYHFEMWTFLDTWTTRLESLTQVAQDAMC
jgi:hypothetical protein